MIVYKNIMRKDPLADKIIQKLYKSKFYDSASVLGYNRRLTIIDSELDSWNNQDLTPTFFSGAVKQPHLKVGRIYTIDSSITASLSGLLVRSGNLNHKTVPEIIYNVKFFKLKTWQSGSVIPIQSLQFLTASKLYNSISSLTNCLFIEQAQLQTANSKTLERPVFNIQGENFLFTNSFLDQTEYEDSVCIGWVGGNENRNDPNCQTIYASVIWEKIWFSIWK